MSYDFKTEIVKAKGQGSAKSASHHWLLQRITGILLALCSVWLICIILSNKNSGLGVPSTANLVTPLNVVFLLISVVTSFYHGFLGTRVVIEDYISCIKLRTTLIIGLQLFCIVTVVAFIIAIFMLINLSSYLQIHPYK